MDFAYDARTEELRGQLQAFIDEQITPAEKVFEEQAAKLANLRGETTSSQAGRRGPGLGTASGDG